MINLSKFVSQASEIIGQLTSDKKEWINEFDLVGTKLINEIKERVDAKDNVIEVLSEADIDEKFRDVHMKLYEALKVFLQFGSTNIDGYVIKIGDLFDEWTELPYELREEGIKVIVELYREKIREVYGVKKDFKYEMFHLFDKKVIEIKDLKKQFVIAFPYKKMQGQSKRECDG